MRAGGIRHEGAEGEIGGLEYEQFRRMVLQLTQIDLDNYKNQQLNRRLKALRRQQRVYSLVVYGERLARDPAELDRFKSWFTINVSEFFRDPARWNDLRKHVLPRLLEHRRALRVWSAGCSHGAEPYSVAMVLRDFPGVVASILATDIDPAALAQANAGGPYGPNDLRQVGPEPRERFFSVVERDGESIEYWVRPEIRRAVKFRAHDLLGDAPGRVFDLIICRNVVIYFTEVAKSELYRRFARALRPGGFLFIGGIEVPVHGHELGLTRAYPAFYTLESPG